MSENSRQRCSLISTSSSLGGSNLSCFVCYASSTTVVGKFSIILFTIYCSTGSSFNWSKGIVFGMELLLTMEVGNPPFQFNLTKVIGRRTISWL